MKMPGTIFICDTVHCHNEYVSASDDKTASYLDLVEIGWVVRRLYNGWKHYCLEHSEDGKT